jgi:hypothetical protein
MAVLLTLTLGGCASTEVAYDYETKMLWLGKRITF